MQDLLLANRYTLKHNEVNMVKAVKGELRMFNISNRNETTDS